MHFLVQVFVFYAVRVCIALMTGGVEVAVYYAMYRSKVFGPTPAFITLALSVTSAGMYIASAGTSFSMRKSTRLVVFYKYIVLR